MRAVLICQPLSYNFSLIGKGNHLVLDKPAKTCYAHLSDTNLSSISDGLKGVQCMSDMLVGILGLICIIGIVVAFGIMPL